MQRATGIRWLPLSILLLAAILCGAPSLIYPFGKDQGTFAWVGHLTIQGAVPYRDAWDVKPPAVFYTYALAELLFGYSMAAIRCLDLIWQTATMLLVYRIARRISSREAPAVLAGVIYIACYFSQGFWNTAQGDGFLNLPMAAAVLLFLGMRDRRVQASRCVAVGALVGIAFYFKYPVALILLVFCAVLARGRGVRTPYSGMLMTAAGFFVVVGGYLAYLSVTGGLDEFLSIQLSFIPRYSRVLSTSVSGARGSLFSLRLHDLFGTYFIYPPLLLISLATCTVSFRQKERADEKRLIAAWALVALVTLYLQRKFYIYHFSPLLPPLSIGASFAIWFVFDRTRRKQLRALALVGILVVCALSWAYSNPRYRRYCMDVYRDSWKALACTRARGAPPESYYMNIRFTSDDFSLPADLVVADYLRRRTRPTDGIHLWGFEPIVHWLAQRRGPSPFIHNFAMRGSWAPRRYAEELLRLLKNAPPLYFLVVRNDRAPWMLGTDEDSETALSHRPELKSWLNENYVLETVIEDFVIYKKRTKTERIQ